MKSVRGLTGLYFLGAVLALQACGGGGGSSTAVIEGAGAQTAIGQSVATATQQAINESQVAANQSSASTTYATPGTGPDAIGSGTVYGSPPPDVTDVRIVAKIAYLSLSHTSLLPSTEQTGISLVTSLFGYSSRNLPAPCYNGGSGSAITTNANARPTVGDKIVSTWSACSNGVRGESYYETTGKSTIELTQLANYQDDATGTWTAEITSSSPNFVVLSDELNSKGKREKSTAKSSRYLVQTVSFNGKNTSSKGDDLQTVVSDYTYSFDFSIESGLSMYGSTKSKTTCSSTGAGATATKLSCDEMAGSLTSDGTAVGYFQTRSSNLGTVTSTPSATGDDDFIQGKYVIYMNNYTMYLEFYGTAAVPLIKLTMPDGRVYPMTLAELLTLVES